jgi:DNA-binding transcriptional LysR family regulator
MELRHLRYFVAVAETGGFSAASRALHVSQSAISEQIADLEDEVQVPLLHRKNRTTALTAYGEVFLERSRDILRMSEQAIQLTRSAYRGETGRLTIGFFVGGVRHWFPQWISEFRKQYPSVTISLVEMPPTALHAALLSGTLDVAFTRPVPSALRTELRTERLYSEDLVVVLPRQHSMAAAQSLRMRELEGQRFVMNERANSPAVFDKVLSLCADAGFSPQIVTQASVSSGVIALVEAGEGIGVLPKGSEQLGSRDVVFTPVADEGATVDLVMAWPARRDDAVLLQFVDLVRSRVRQKTIAPKPPVKRVQRRDAT